MRIPDTKHIRFTCSACDRNYEYNNGERIRRKYWIPIASVLLIFTGLIANELYPITYLLGISSFFWWLFKRSRNKIKNLISNLASPTALGLAIVFIMQLMVNFINKPKGLEVPNWLLQLDKGLIWIRQYLTYLSEIGLGSYLLIIIALLIVAIKKPNWKPISKLKALEGRIGKGTFIIIVVTSFSFFAPTTCEKLLEQSYFNFYQVQYREQLKQERISLIAKALQEHLELEKWKPYQSRKTSLTTSFQSLDKEELIDTITIEKDVNKVMRMIGMRSIVTRDPITLRKRYASDAAAKDAWNREFKRWNRNKKKSSNETKSNPRVVTDAQINKTKKATILANEAQQGVKSAYLKFVGAISPTISPLLNNYLDEAISTIAEYLYDTSNVNSLVEDLFNNSGKTGRLVAFSKIFSWKTKIDHDIAKAEKQRQLKVDRQQAVEEQKLIKENRALQIELERQVATLDINRTLENWDELKSNLEIEQIQQLTKNEASNLVKEVITKNMLSAINAKSDKMNLSTQNRYLKETLAVANNSFSLMGFLNTLYGPIGACSRCGFPEIPGTPCIAR